MKPSDPTCNLCKRQYDATFETGLPCRVFSHDDVVTPGCPAQQHMFRYDEKHQGKGSPRTQTRWRARRFRS